jgi:hypothetical protein
MQIIIQSGSSTDISSKRRVLKTRSFSYRFLPTIWDYSTMYLLLFALLVWHLATHSLNTAFIISLVLLPIFIACCRRTFKGPSWLVALASAALLSMVFVSPVRGGRLDPSLAGLCCLMICTLLGRARAIVLNKTQAAEAWICHPLISPVIISAVLILCLASYPHAAQLISILIGVICGGMMGIVLSIRGGRHIYTSPECKIIVTAVEHESNNRFKSINFSIVDFDKQRQLVVEEKTVFNCFDRKSVTYKRLAGKSVIPAEQAAKNGSLAFFACPSQAQGETASAYSRSGLLPERHGTF